MSRVITDELLSILRGNSGGFPVGDAVAPDSLSTPYGVLYPLDTVDRDGDWETIDVTGWVQYQVTSVGVTREQAQGLEDQLRSTLLGSSPSVPGYALGPMRLGAIDGAIERDDDVDPILFYSITLFEIFVSPTS